MIAVNLGGRSKEGLLDLVGGPTQHWMRRTFELQDPQHARLLPMEGLRGIAVTLVFLQHYTVQAQLIGLPPGLSSLVASVFHLYGNYGVELFFVLSGYLIYGTLIRRAPPFLGFMARRFQRIYPAFLVVFGFTLTVTILRPMPSKIPDDGWQAAFMLGTNLTLLSGLIPTPRIVEVAWSLSYEMFFYLVTAALVLWTGMSKARRNRRIGVLLLLTGAFLLGSSAGIPYFPLRMMPFFAGMLLAEGLGDGIPAWMGWAAPLAAFVASAAHVVTNAAAAEFVQTGAFFLLCAVCFRGDGIVSACMRWVPLRWLGNMSYSYYLAHGFVVRGAMLMLATSLPQSLSSGGMADWMFWGFMPVLYAASILVSSLLFIAIEKPISLRPAGTPPSAVRSWFRMAKGQRT